jgi:hypothetical protein
MASIFRTKEYQSQTDPSEPLSGGFLEFLLTTTTTPKAAYPTEADALAGTNGFTTRTLDADGRCPTEVWLTGRYRIRTYTSSGGTLIADDDPIEDFVTGSDAQDNSPTYGGDNTGTADALVFTYSPAISAYTNGQILRGRITADNTGAVTINAGGGVKSLTKWNAGALIAGDLQGPDVIEFIYDSTTDVFRLNTPTYQQLARLDTNQSFTKAQGVNRVALTDAATVAVDASLSNVFTLTLAGNRTLGQPTNPKDGQGITIFITQSGGSNTLAYHADWLFPGGTDPVLSTGAGAVDVFSAVYNGATTKWYAVLNKAFA